MEIIHRQPDGRWRIEPLAYPNLRQRLAEEGFLTDSL
jgi:hypothetical protein